MPNLTALDHPQDAPNARSRRTDDLILPLTAAGEIDRTRLPVGEVERRGMQPALADCFVRMSNGQALLIAIDDADRTDAATLAVLGMMAERPHRHRLLIAGSSERSEHDELPGLAVLARRCRSLGLRPLEPAVSTARARSGRRARDRGAAHGGGVGR